MPDTMIQSSPIVTTTGMPADIAKAIGEVMAQVKSLPKGERNEHGGYNFASIDDFLAAIGPLCSAAGLIVYQDEDSIDLIDRGNKAWLKATYSFRLGLTSGAISDRPIRRTVFQAITGPQTTGSCQSYCLKQFLRSLFLIPTGDRDDADYHLQQDMPAQARQESQDRDRPAQRPMPQAPARAAPAASHEPQHMPLQVGQNGPLVNRWTRAALEALEGRPVEWRYAWLALHPDEMAEIHQCRPDNWTRINDAVIGADTEDAA
jgi:hypothetical protein